MAILRKINVDNYKGDKKGVIRRKSVMRRGWEKGSFGLNAAVLFGAKSYHRRLGPSYMHIIVVMFDGPGFDDENDFFPNVGR